MKIVLFPQVKRRKTELGAAAMGGTKDSLKSVFDPVTGQPILSKLSQKYRLAPREVIYFRYEAFKFVSSSLETSNSAIFRHDLATAYL